MKSEVIRVITSYLESEEIKYQMKGENSDVIRVGFNGKNKDTVEVLLFVSDDGKNVAFRSFNLVKFPAEKITDMYKICSQMNAEYRWIKFYVDEKDNTVTAEADAVIEFSTAGAECLEIILRSVRITDDAYPNFMKSVWG